MRKPVASLAFALSLAGATPLTAAPLGSYYNPIPDVKGGDLSVPVHRGMYCANGAWHYGWLRPWEHSPVIKASCGGAAAQMPR
ncbi:hypothetical protein [Methylosinus sp. Sm6]|uniref:hypothetical protein n=1 Tax=Methylosinus sp. Sm6 TaxID=2866948 RepID=UPI001C993E05|nr:hypothetical protein [Methylosinus sp. Sm6]MBY6242683.1 hypothetical protein [Methylosinus sp. Sm6]